MNSDDPTIITPRPDPTGDETQVMSSQTLAREVARQHETHHYRSAPTPEELSELLPQYRIEKMLGRGGMGAVYKGVQQSLDRPVAIKLLLNDLADDEGFIARFQREARMLALLQHPGIVSIYGFGQTSKGHLYFVMEYVDGTDLATLISRGELNETQSLDLLVQVAHALRYAHAQGVIHRDLKPANILVTRDGHAKVADFGLARPMSEDHLALTMTGVVMGTPAYMAPEQRLGMTDQRTDIFALGVIFYEMLTGTRPEGIFDPPSTKSHTDPRLDVLVNKAMQDEPERRYQELDTLLSEADEIRKDIGVGAKELKQKASSNRRPSRKAKVLFSITATALILAGLVYLQNKRQYLMEVKASVAPGSTDGLISWWKGDGDALDSSGKNHGALKGKAGFADGLFGKAFSLEGGYVEVPDAPSLRFGTDSKFTVSLWAFSTDSTLPYHLFGKRIGPGGNTLGLEGYQLGLDHETPSTPIKRWVFWSLVYDGKVLSLYIDGAWAMDYKKIGKLPPPNNATFKIGGSGGYRVFRGLIDEFRIYDHALSRAQIKTLFDEQKAAASESISKLEGAEPRNSETKS